MSVEAVSDYRSLNDVTTALLEQIIHEESSRAVANQFYTTLPHPDPPQMRASAGFGEGEKRSSTMFPHKERTPEEADALIRDLAWSDEFGCYTKNGFKKLIWPEIAEDARWLLYFDVDGVHNINKANKGYAAFDAMIFQVLSILRLTDYVAGQKNSGDEFLVCLVEKKAEPGEIRQVIDPDAMMQRLIDELRRQGLTAIFSIVPVVSLDLDVNLKPAIEQVFLAKEQRGAQPR